MTPVAKSRAAAFVSLARAARAAGILEPGVTVADITLVMQIAQAAVFTTSTTGGP